MPRVPPVPLAKPLRTIDLARAAGVNIETVRRLERRGLLHCVRDYRGWRAFAPSEVARLRELLGWRVLEPVEPEPPGVNAEAHAETAAGERPTPCR
jgi:hypothetical protein